MSIANQYSNDDNNKTEKKFKNVKAVLSSQGVACHGITQYYQIYY